MGSKQSVPSSAGSSADDETEVSTPLCVHYSPGTSDTEYYTQVELEEAMFRVLYNRIKPVTAFDRFLFSLSQCWQCCSIYARPPCPPCIIHKIAFRPFKSTYNFVSFGSLVNGEHRMRLSEDMHRLLSLFCPDHRPFRRFLRCFYIPRPDKTGERIACAYCSSRSFGTPPRKTVLLSHNNAEDLGMMSTRIAALCQLLQVDVVAYDYSGYGLSDGKCSERKLYQDVEIVYDFMLNKMKIAAEQVVAMGTSLGTAATIHLASLPRFVTGAVVLQGSFASALRVVCPNSKSCICIDQFVSEDKIEYITCPTLFVHGENDTFFALDHVQVMRRKCPGASHIEPMIIKGGDHLDFEFRDEYWQRLRTFIHQDSPATQDAGHLGPDVWTYPESESGLK